VAQHIAEFKQRLAEIEARMNQPASGRPPRPVVKEWVRL
jgi:hypothetical protein